MSQPSSPGAVVIDVNILLAICTKEPKEQTARTALADYATNERRRFRAVMVAVVPLIAFISPSLKNSPKAAQQSY